MARPKFKHFQAGEVAAVERFQAKGYLVGEYRFDVPLRTITKEQEMLVIPVERASYLYRSSKKIDLVVETWAAIWIIEVKWKVRPSAVGQLIVYRDMYKELFQPAKPIKLGIIAALDDISTRKVAEKMGFTIWIV